MLLLFLFIDSEKMLINSLEKRQIGFAIFRFRITSDCVLPMGLVAIINTTYRRLIYYRYVPV